MLVVMRSVVRRHHGLPPFQHMSWYNIGQGHGVASPCRQYSELVTAHHAVISDTVQGLPPWYHDTQQYASRHATESLACRVEVVVRAMTSRLVY